jgi:hypothetical protein
LGDWVLWEGRLLGMVAGAIPPLQSLLLEVMLMQLCTETPLDSFISAVGRRSIAKVFIASPFLSNSGVNLILDWTKNRRSTELYLLTNLSEFNLLLSLNDPIAPIKLLKNSLGDRLQAKTLSNLHAKLFLADEKVGMAGSSNLTQGGAATNRELNWLFTDQTKAGAAHLANLSDWFERAWALGGDCPPLHLDQMHERWRNNNKAILGKFATLVPDPWLAGNPWQKVQDITAEKKMSRKLALAILARQDDQRELAEDFDEATGPKNAVRKLAFLENAGLVQIDKDIVKSVRKMKKTHEMVTILDNHLPGFKDVRGTIEKQPGVTYKELAASLSILENDHNMGAAVNWLVCLGMIRRETGGKHRFFSV